VKELAAYYEALGYPPSRWHIGAEHPSLEAYAIRLIGDRPRARVLEVGYQAGGFAVPLILALHGRPGFAYVGVDSMAYGSAVEGRVIAGYLEHRGVKDGYEFVERDAHRFLLEVSPPFDLVLIDHDKRLYPRDLRTVLERELVSVDGLVLLHDVLGKARRVWHDCLAIAHAYGWSPEIVDEVPEGLAVLRRDPEPRALSPRRRVALGSALIRIRARQLTDAARAWRRGSRGRP
jgi:predicted O-methyltransferase YrrM